MSLNDPTHSRLDSLEQSISRMSEQVGQVARYMERLVVLEERNGYMLEQHRELKETVNKRIDLLEGKVQKLSEKMLIVWAFATVATTAITLAAPHVLKAMTGGAV